MDERARRVWRNEALFREVNEQVESLNREFAAEGEETIEIVCECCNLACIESIAVLILTYERVRADATLFFVKPGHEEPTAEEVLEQARTYLIVRKPAQARRAAEAADGRSN